MDFCDGIIYINQDEKTFELTKRYWVTCQFARFVKKGARRIQIASPDKDLMLLAFVKDGKTAVVAVNLSAQEKEVDFGKGEARVYLTDAEHDLACTSGADLAGVELPPRSRHHHCVRLKVEEENRMDLTNIAIQLVTFVRRAGFFDGIACFCAVNAPIIKRKAVFTVPGADRGCRLRRRGGCRLKR